MKELHNESKLFNDINDFLEQTNKELTNENANKDAKIVSTHRDLIAGIVSKHMAADILPQDVIEWHQSGHGHIHDLDYFLSTSMTNCCLVNYRDMLKNGFKLGNANVGTPNSIGVACTVLTQVVLAVASSQYGGQSLAHIDFGLEPYVEKSYKKLLKIQEKYNLPDSYVEETLEKEVYDAMQTLLYQVNSMTSGNGQTPFITLSLGLNTSKFGKLITSQYLKVHEKGLGTDCSTPVFPKVIFFLEEGVNANKNDPNWDLKLQAMQCSTKRIYPDFISVPLNKKLTGSTTEAVTSMGCRSFLSKWINPETNQEQYDGRCNLGVISLNLPLIALESVGIGDFYSKLDQHMTIAYKAHMFRIERLKGTKAKENPIMFMQGVLARLKAEDTIDSLLYDGRSSISIGFVGLSEACELLNGELNKGFCLEVLKYMKYKCEQFTKDTHLAFSLYGTPAESLCYKFAKAVESNFPNVLKRDFITNSFHQPVWVESTIFEKFDYESGFAELSSGGNISYVEVPNLKNNIIALNSIIDYASTKVQYFGLNQPVDHCYECNFSGEFSVDKDGFHCPECNNRNESTISVIRRVSGYLGSCQARPFNTGKQAEVIERIKHSN